MCAAIGLKFHPGMLNPYEDSGKKMTDGIHPLSQQVGDHNFEKHKAVKAEVAETWRTEYTRDFLGAETWRVAKLLGYENPFGTGDKEPTHKRDGLSPIVPVARQARRIKESTTRNVR